MAKGFHECTLEYQPSLFLTSLLKNYNFGEINFDIFDTICKIRLSTEVSSIILYMQLVHYYN